MGEAALNGATAITETLAQTETPPPGGEASPTGGFGNPMTFLLLVVAALFLWWTMRRRRTQEERVRALHREQSVAQAEESARNVAHLMRSAPPPGAAAAAAAEGLASAAHPLTATRTGPNEHATDRGAETSTERASDTIAPTNERAEAVALAEQAAAEQAHRAADEAEARRMQATREGATEARADTAEVELAGVAPNQDALRSALRELDSEIAPPFGAMRGDGTVHCPPEFPIKGNSSSKIYQEPGQSSYALTVAEFCFASTEAAEAAGYRQSRARGQRAQE